MKWKWQGNGMDRQKTGNLLIAMFTGVPIGKMEFIAFALECHENLMS